MSQFYRTKALRSELYSYIRDIGRTQGLMVKNANNAERPRMRGSDTLAKIAMGAASLAGGFYVGKQLGKSGFGDTSKLDRGSWRLKKQY